MLLQDDGFADWAAEIFKESAVAMSPESGVGALFVAALLGLAVSTGIAYATRRDSQSDAKYVALVELSFLIGFINMLNLFNIYDSWVQKLSMLILDFVLIFLGLITVLEEYHAYWADLTDAKGRRLRAEVWHGPVTHFHLKLKLLRRLETNLCYVSHIIRIYIIKEFCSKILTGNT